MTRRLALSMFPPLTRAAVVRYVTCSAGLHLAWELAQLPLYTIWRTGSSGARAFAVAHCTAGDLIIASWTLAAAIILARGWSWPLTARLPVAALNIALAVGYTAYSEWYNVYYLRAWAYSEAMPTLTVAGHAIGLSPLLQWVAVPSAAFALVYGRANRA